MAQYGVVEAGLGILVAVIACVGVALGSQEKEDNLAGDQGIYKDYMVLPDKSNKSVKSLIDFRALATHPVREKEIQAWRSHPARTMNPCCPTRT